MKLIKTGSAIFWCKLLLAILTIQLFFPVYNSLQRTPESSELPEFKTGSFSFSSTVNQKSSKLYRFTFLKLSEFQSSFPIPQIAPMSRELLYLSYIRQVRNLIHKSFIRPVKDETLVSGALLGMKKVLPSIKSSERYNWENFEKLYLGYAQMNPHLAGKLGEAAIDGMVDSLNDPYSVLLTPAKRQVLEGGDGSGIGVELGSKDGRIIVIAPIVGSPAENAGLKSGDIIVAIKGKSVRNSTLYNASMLITGKKGEKIDITVVRNGKILTLCPTFAPLKIEPIKYLLLDRNIGYIRIGIFTGKILKEFTYALNVMKQKKVRGLILDLRNNPGGDFDEALRIAARFVSSGNLVWVAKREGAPQPKTSGSGETFPAPVVILVNEGSASASEVLACAVAENGKATLIGRRTFGKGVVQTEFKLSGGAILKLTTDRYLAPSKKEIDGVGIQPKIQIDNAKQDPDPTKDGFVIEAWKRLDKSRV